VISEVCLAQLAYWCASDGDPLVLKHGELSTVEEVQEIVEVSGGSRDLTLPVLFREPGGLQHVYRRVLPHWREGRACGSAVTTVFYRSEEAAPGGRSACRPGSTLLASDRVSTKGVRLGYADINCLMEEFPAMTEYLLGYASDIKLTEIARIFTDTGD